MARKSPQDDVLDTAIAEDDVLDTAKNPWDEKRTIFLPKAPKREPNYLIASVNGRVFKIRRGEIVEVPLPIAQVVENSFKDADAADEYIEKSVFEE